MSAQPQSALLIGATGATGRHVLRELCRTPTLHALESLDVARWGRSTWPKEWQDGRWDVILITLGTTKANAGSAEKFEKIDREYVINAAKAAKSTDPAHQQRLVYLSSSGANASSPFLYPKSKGLTEHGLASLGYSDFIAFRPGFLKGAERDHSRIAESVFGFITGALSHVTSAAEIHIRLLITTWQTGGRSGPRIVNAGRLGTANLPVSAKASPVPAHEGTGAYTVIGNAGAIALSKEK
ncbi:oxidoreductase HTATIP2 [Ceratobasidium sp. AG-Ba]|nr:oxidoreductase HTATIP2 [Ceratobasidium sp. AG-Ba]